jgi:hypothetical protein
MGAAFIESDDPQSHDNQNFGNAEQHHGQSCQLQHAKP